MYSVDMSSADRYHVKETIALQDSKTAVLFDVGRPGDPPHIGYCLFMEKYIILV